MKPATSVTVNALHRIGSGSYGSGALTHPVYPLRAALAG